MSTDEAIAASMKRALAADRVAAGSRVIVVRGVQLGPFETFLKRHFFGILGTSPSPAPENLKGEMPQ